MLTCSVSWICRWSWPLIFSSWAENVLTLNLRDTYLFGFNEANLNIATFGRRMETCGVFWLLLLFLLLRMLSFSSLLQSRCSDSQQRDLPQSSCVQGCSRCVVNSPASPGLHEPGLQHPARQCWEKGSIQLRTAPWLQFPFLTSAFFKIPYQSCLVSFQICPWASKPLITWVLFSYQWHCWLRAPGLQWECSGSKKGLRVFSCWQTAIHGARVHSACSRRHRW